MQPDPLRVSRETSAPILSRIEQLVRDEQQRQNLISAGTLAVFQERHIEDSLQLLPHLRSGVLVDIGSGGGFPGLVLASQTVDPIHLIEPRTKRAAFLAEASAALGFDHVTVHAAKVERVALAPVATISARAVAALSDLFAWAHHLADPRTRWVLPKGRSAASELEEARRSWQGDFRLVPSLTDPEASIVIAENVRRRSSR
jgi:16S rRNA (guanine527-N7)-methyltransferase